MEQAQEWLPSGYSEGVIYPFIDGEYYHLGSQNKFDDRFNYRGVFIYDGGFTDKDGYYLKPYPSHYIHIEKPSNPKRS